MSSFKSGFVSIIGRPNVGKSTLLNKLTGEKIAIMSDKPQTTRNTIQSVITGEDYQMVFIDTPGIHRPKHKLGEYMVKAAENTLEEVDLVLFLTESAAADPGPGDLFIIEQLKKINTPVILVINKIDQVKKEQLLIQIKNYKDLMGFHSVIPISALTGEGLNIIMDEIRRILPEGPKYFPDDMLTDQPERKIVAELIREKILQLLFDEVPHGIGVEIDSIKKRENRDLVDIQATIFCEKDTHKSIIIGKNGSMLKQIGQKARIDIENLLGSRVFLELWVKVKKDWRNDMGMLKMLGYE